MSAPFGIPPGSVPVAGRIRTVAGQPVPEAVLTVLDAHGNPITTARSDPDGGFQLTAHTGRAHLLLATAAGYEPAAFSLPAGPAAAPLDLTLTAVTAAHGTIHDTDTAEPLGDAVVTVATGRGDVLATARAGPAGRYMFTGIPPGTYTLVATAAGHQPAARTLAVPAGNPAVEHDLPLTATATLTGIVHTPSGLPVAGVEVRAHRAGTDPAVVPAAVTHTAADGHFQFTDLPPGRYCVQAPGHVPATTSVTLPLTSPQPHAADFALHAIRYPQPPMPGLPATQGSPEPS
jgi:hypothetical protein